MEGFLHRLRLSLHRGRGVTLPSDHKAAMRTVVATIFSDDASTLEEMVNSNPELDLNGRFHRSQRTLMLAAAQANSYDCLCLLLRKGADPNLSDVSGTTPFVAACRNGHRKIVKKLISLKEIDITAKDMAGLTGVHWMAASGRIDCLTDCLSHFIKNVDLLDEQGQTPLHVATKNGHIRAMELLIENGANINTMSNSGDTPLHYACTNGQLPGLTLLLSKNAVYKSNKKGEYPIEMAVRGEHASVIKLLIEKYPDMLYALVQLVLKDQVEEKMLTRVLSRVVKEFPVKDTVLMQLAEIASNCGLKLLTPVSIIDIELFGLMRSIRTLSSLCKGASAEQIQLVEQPLSDVWNSMVGWFALLSDKISDITDLSQVDINTSLTEAECERTTPEKRSSTPSLVKSESTESKIRHRDIELHTLCPRLSCLLQAYYAVCLITNKDTESTPDNFLQFVSDHEREIEYIIRRNPDVIFEHFEFLLSSQLNSRLFRFVKIQSFSARKDWFHKQLVRQSESGVYSPGSMEDILIARDSLFTSSCHQLLRRDPNDLKKNLVIKFQEEDGMGQGVVKDWFDALSQELLNPDYGLFTVSPDGATFQPNPMSYVNPDHLNYFNFAGQIIGLALYHRQLVSVYFTRSFYKHILDIPVNYRDVESIDPEYARNLQWILDNDITELALDLTFSVENNVFGVQELTELKNDGASIPVTEDNKQEYVQLVTKQKMTRSIRPQINSFLLGFHKFIPATLTKIFDEYELELLLSGLPDINMDDWKSNTDFINYSDDEQIIQWFWELLEEMDREERVQILQFSTGSSRVPFGGFCHLRGGEAEQKFTISRDYGEENRLPSASTCVNMLKLPLYESKDILKQNLRLAIDCSTGFGMA